MYEGDDPLSDGISIVWPQFIDADGSMLPEGEVPVEGRALMFIVNPERRLFHRRRVAVGIRGFFMEGPKKVADCEITAVLGLHWTMRPNSAAESDAFRSALNAPTRSAPRCGR